VVTYSTVRAHVPPVLWGNCRTSGDVTKSLTLMRHNTTNMDPTLEVLAAIELRDVGDNHVYQEYADFWGVDQATLARRHQGRQRSRSTLVRSKSSSDLMRVESIYWVHLLIIVCCCSWGVFPSSSEAPSA
jgi:hypothetical protein